MSNLAHTAQNSSLMPSPLYASGPQNEMEQRLQGLIVQGMHSGEAVAYASAADFACSLRERAALRATSAAKS